MHERWVHARNKVIGGIYRKALKPFFFRLDPEAVHDGMTLLGAVLGKTALTRAATQAMFGYRHPALVQTVAGIRFENPLGLSAGFDKEGRLTGIIPDVGFGFMEVGSVTGTPCPGNPRPRLWRLPELDALVVYYGLKSSGAVAAARRLQRKSFRLPLGMNIAKANLKEMDSIEEGVADYMRAATALRGIGDYVTVNISCPNTSGGEPFADPGHLDHLLSALDGLALTAPLFVKLPVDLSKAEVEDLLAVAERHRVTGFVCTNLSKRRDLPVLRGHSVPPHGGISGKVVEGQSNVVLRHVARRSRGRFVLIGVGGVFSAEDAYKKIRLGASLVQLITGMIYRGPQVISEINQGLVQLLLRDGFTNIADAVGADQEKEN